MYWFNWVIVTASKGRVSVISNLSDILYCAVKPFLGLRVDGIGRRRIVNPDESRVCGPVNFIGNVLPGPDVRRAYPWWSNDVSPTATLRLRSSSETSHNYPQT